MLAGMVQSPGLGAGTLSHTGWSGSSAGTVPVGHSVGTAGSLQDYLVASGKLVYPDPGERQSRPVFGSSLLVQVGNCPGYGIVLPGLFRIGPPGLVPTVHQIAL